MKYLSQCAYIFGVTFAGEVLHNLLPLPIPAAIYGLCLLFLALCAGLVKPEQVSGVSKFLIAIMGILFVAPGVNLMDSVALLRGNLVGIVVVVLVSTVVVFGASGVIAQWILGRKHHD